MKITDRTISDIKKVIEAFAAASVRIQKSGFDGVPLHIAHGYILNQFLSPYFNRRTDEYGGRIENRTRFITDTFSAIRKLTGNNFAVLVKINCDDFM